MTDIAFALVLNLHQPAGNLGTLLEALADPGFQQRAYGLVDCGSLLWHLQNTRIIDILGTAYYHPVLPLAPAP
jgi:hypothetical protein